MSTTLLVDPPPVATAPPASRASWSGQLRLGSCCVPVKAYPTISSNSARVAAPTPRWLRGTHRVSQVLPQARPRAGRPDRQGLSLQRRAVRRAERRRPRHAGADRRQDHPPGTLPLPDRIRPDAAGRSQSVPRAGPPGGNEALRRDPPSPAARTNGPSAGPSSPASVNW